MSEAGCKVEKIDWNKLHLITNFMKFRIVVKMKQKMSLYFELLKCTTKSKIHDNTQILYERHDYKWIYDCIFHAFCLNAVIFVDTSN